MTSLWAGVVLGFVSSAHCAAMCGPLVAAIRGSLFRGGPSAAAWRARASGVVYHAGRIAIYAALGFAAGRFGDALALHGFSRTVALVAGIVLLLGVIGHATGPMTAIGRGVAARLARLSAVVRRHSASHPFMASAGLGAVNGLLPCGLVYAALTMALTMNGPRDAAVFMSAFGAGTTPAVLGAWLLAGWRPLARRRFGFLVAPAVMTIAAVLLIARALSMPAGHVH